MTMIALIIFSVLAGSVVAQQNAPSPSPYEYPRFVSENYGGKLPFFPSDELSVVDCSEEVKSASRCGLMGDSEGVFVCRRVGVVPLSICSPNIMESEGRSTSTVLGFEGDTCGCCGETCPQTCACECNDGRGVLIETFVVRWWHVQVCVPKLWADYVTPLRKEIRCSTCDGV
jgi:hypothetical protein